MAEMVMSKYVVSLEQYAKQAMICHVFLIS